MFFILFLSKQIMSYDIIEDDLLQKPNGIIKPSRYFKCAFL